MAMALGQPVQGKRRSIPLTLTQISEHKGSEQAPPGFTLAVPRTVPGEGAWVIHVVGRATWGEERHALVVLGGEGIDRSKTRLRMDTCSPAEITAALSR